MTMRTYRHFACPNGHTGIEKTSENDQPYSAAWESVTTTGLIEVKADQNGYPAYVCEICKQPMAQVKKV
jgi:hypothetical protein